jgi:serine/threonine-protein kinase
MVGAFGEVYLVDWGIAAPLTGSGADEKRALTGTPAYMAPEMVMGGPIDERTDVYLLGATLHEIVTARPRHPGSELHAVLMHAVLSEPVSYGEEVPAELAELANRATHRPQTATGSCGAA